MARMVRGGTTKPDASGLNCVGIVNTVTPTPLAQESQHG